jgi:uncharacterized protein (TIGR03435 family)
MLATVAVSLSAQSPKPAFEVASVKRQSRQVQEQTIWGSTPRPTFYWPNVTVASLIRNAYGLKEFELIGGPDWVRKDLFEINAKPAGTPEQDRLRLQSLMESRFKLVLRSELRVMRVYDLVVARKDGRLGPDMMRCEDPRQPQPRNQVRRVIGANPIPIVAWCGSLEAATMRISDVLQAPVVDRTGLNGLWSYALIFAERSPLSASSAVQSAGAQLVPSMEDGLRDRLGLKLEPRSGPVKVFAIQSVQQPTEN